MHDKNRPELIQLTEEELKELQKKSLDIVQYIADLCKEHHVKFFLYAGSLLGAVREHGFIPWDDDMDICFTPDEYKKFIEIWNEYADQERYSLCIQGKHYNDHTLSDSVRDNHTTFITDSTVKYDVNQGLSVDLGCLVVTPNSKIGQLFQVLIGAGLSLFKAGRVPARQSKAIKTAARIILGVFRTEMIQYHMWHFLEMVATLPNRNYRKARYLKELSMFPYITWVFKKEWFDDIKWVPFEDTELPIPVGAEEYLKIRYGNYMELPPEKDRHPEHRIVFMDLHTPYKKYRGEKYF
ncbi:MAG: LicD family protein [Oscillospiraceae bacterium]|nr:LicD family protein [Oscillospiraceae bacterium]